MEPREEVEGGGGKEKAKVLVQAFNLSVQKAETG